jgi:hypothetical protein
MLRHPWIPGKVQRSMIPLVYGIMLLLRNIFKVVGPIGVNLIGPLTIPVTRSFGPIPWASSEGFLDSFTPGKGAKVIFCGYSFFSEELSKSLHLFDGRQSIQGRRRSGRNPSQGRVYTPRVRQEWQYCQSEGERTQGRLPRERMRHNLMMTNLPTLGILGSLNPTDEVLEKDRNTKVTWINLRAFGTHSFVPQIFDFEAKQKAKNRRIGRVSFETYP